MKKLLLAATALAMLTTAASAAQMSKPVYLFKGGAWETYAMASNDAGIPMCGMQTFSKNYEYAFYVKWTQGGMAIQAGKYGWRLPKDATKVSWQLVLIKTKDDTNTLTTENGWVGSTGASIYMRVKDEDTETFLQAFGEANGALIKFTEGDEPPWEMKMEGSRKATAEFAKCIQYMKQTRSTSPIAKSPVKPTSPMPPVQPTNDRKRATKDDGSV